MNWGWKLAIVMGIFMVGVLAVVFYTMTLDVNLVADDYYQQELAYEEQITRMKNTESLAAKPSMEKSNDGKLLILTFPAELNPENGEIVLYRPSDFNKDRRFKLSLDDSKQQGFVSETLQQGLWRAKLTWEAEDKSYYQEFVIVM
jgi:hypothetical protein